MNTVLELADQWTIWDTTFGGFLVAIMRAAGVLLIVAGFIVAGKEALGKGSVAKGFKSLALTLVIGTMLFFPQATIEGFTTAIQAVLTQISDLVGDAAGEGNTGNGNNPDVTWGGE